MKKKNRRTGRIILLVLMILAVSCFAYLGTGHYRPEDAAIRCLSEVCENGRTEIRKGHYAAFIPEECKGGIIFYPGAKVDYEAYAPLMMKFARAGYLAVVADMPFDFAFFGSSRASEIRARFPEVSDWYMAGHSLGGVVAASYVKKHAAEYKGILFFASYTASDLSDSDLTAVVIYGSEDGVRNEESFEKNRKYLPDGTDIIMIRGGNHAGFGCYGEQKGDHPALIDPETQQSLAVQRILEEIE